MLEICQQLEAEPTPLYLQLALNLETTSGYISELNL